MNRDAIVKGLVKPIRLNGEVAYVPLTQGFEAVIDASDAALVEGFNWYARVDGNTVYALRKDRTGGHCKTILMHRLILGESCTFAVDHADGNGLNNTRRNLRYATTQQNQQNQRKSKGRSSKYKGVTLHKPTGKWLARIRVDGHLHYIGQYDDERAAALAYNARAKSICGPFARLNEFVVP